jgi:sporulation protein YlmC with PRC-barrel domain
VLKSVRDLEKLRVVSQDGVACGRIKDLYFNDQNWTIKNLVFSVEPRQFGAKQVLLLPTQVRLNGVAAYLDLPSDEICTLPRVGSVLPVCRQYASFAFNSPGASRLVVGDPHLRSARAVAKYRINVDGQECGGTLEDFIFEEESWEIRYLAVEQTIGGRKVNFHVLPQSVERFTWATQRVWLRDLQPVELAAEERLAVLAA